MRASMMVGAGAVAIAMMAIAGCKQVPVTTDEYRKEITEWQKQRTTRLQSETNWLTLFGLFWLKEGENRIGTDSTNDIVCPAGKAPSYAGSFIMKEGRVSLAAAKGAQFMIGDSAISTAVMRSDEEGNEEPTTVRLGTLSFFVIKRGDRFAIRARDSQNPARLNFKGLEFFPVDARWKIDARFEPYDPPKIIPIATIINTVENDTCPGAIVFEVDGREYRLDATKEVGTADKLFVMFSDETSGKETYGLGRQMYTDLPKENKVVIDFNRAYNWPCVYTTFATCPIPPRQNHVPIRIDAGEKMPPGH